MDYGMGLMYGSIGFIILIGSFFGFELFGLSMSFLD